MDVRAPDLYFQLIHTRTSIPNQWVDAFYHRLDLEVKRQARPVPGLRLGSLYFATAGEAGRAREIGHPRARVLVPLYTREFLHEPPPDFEGWLHRVEDPAEAPFVHPVLWEAHLPARQVHGFTQAVSLGESIPEYLDCGMASISRLHAFTVELHRIVERLARRLVSAAEAPHQPPGWYEGRPGPPTPPPAPAPSFLIIVIQADWRDPGWSPYDSGPMSERAMAAARWHSLLPEARENGLKSTTDGLQDAAGVLLLDAGILDDPRDRRATEQFLRLMPPWMVMVMVIGTDHADRAYELTADARAIAPNGLQIARNRREFHRAVDEAVAKARLRFLRSRQPRRPEEDPR